MKRAGVAAAIDQRHNDVFLGSGLYTGTTNDHINRSELALNDSQVS